MKERKMNRPLLDLSASPQVKMTVSQFIQYCVYLHVAEVFSVSVLCKGKNFKRSLGPSSVVKLLPVNLSKITGISLRVW